MAPEVFDDGTHYVVNQKLTLETLREIVSVTIIF